MSNYVNGYTFYVWTSKPFICQLKKQQTPGNKYTPKNVWVEKGLICYHFDFDINFDFKSIFVFFYNS